MIYMYMYIQKILTNRTVINGVFFISIIKTKIMIRICKLSVLRILKCKAFTYTNTQAHVSSQ